MSFRGSSGGFYSRIQSLCDVICVLVALDVNIPIYTSMYVVGSSFFAILSTNLSAIPAATPVVTCFCAYDCSTHHPPIPTRHVVLLSVTLSVNGRERRRAGFVLKRENIWMSAVFEGIYAGRIRPESPLARVRCLFTQNVHGVHGRQYFGLNNVDFVPPARMMMPWGKGTNSEVHSTSPASLHPSLPFLGGRVGFVDNLNAVVQACRVLCDGYH